MSEVIRDTAVPLYMQIAGNIKEKIANRESLPGSRLPTEAELSKSYEVSRITVRKALELLVEDEILVRKQRLGTFVLDKKISRNLNHFMGFSQCCELEGEKPGTRLLSAELVKARPADIRALRLEEGDKVICIRRLRFCNDVPVILEENHFPRKYAYLLAEDLSRSLHEILREHGIALASGSKTIGVCYATRDEAEHLGIKENDVLILSRDITYNTEGEPVYNGKEVINADRYEYKISTNNMAEKEGL